MASSCEATRAELVAFCKGEVSPGERAAIGLHLEDCAPCREELNSFEALFRLARSANRIGASPDFRLALRDQVMAARARSTRRRRMVAVLAPALVIALLAVLSLERRSRTPAQAPTAATNPAPADATAPDVAALAEANPMQAVDRALAWLASEQDAREGCWWPEQSGGRAEARVGVSALALLAFVYGSEPQRARYRDVIDRGKRFLERSADTEFLVGAVPGDEAVSRFNHATAVLALNGCAGLNKDPGITHNVEMNLASLCARVNGSPSTYDEAFLMLALRAGQTPTKAHAIELEDLTRIAWTDADPSERSHAKLFGLPRGAEAHGPATGGAYAQVLQMLEQPWQREPAFVFFATAALRVGNDQDWPRYRELLLDRFTRNQTQSGAWNPWQKPSPLPGGDVYSTAMHVLSLHVCLGSFLP